MDDAESGISSNTESINALEERVESAEGDIDDIEANLGDNKKAGTTAFGRIEAAESSIETLKTGLGEPGDGADKDGSAFARIAYLAKLGLKHLTYEVWT